MSWNRMPDAPETSFYKNIFVDLLVKTEHYGLLFRVPDCFLNNGEWWSIFYKWPLRDMGWHPVGWMPVPEIPIE